MVPISKMMARLAHTGYVLHGRSSLNILDTIRETMFAPSVIGSPLENACRVIGRYEPYGRGYYSGILALMGCDADGACVLDSSIIIRTADIHRNGRLNLGVGATLVRHFWLDQPDPVDQVGPLAGRRVLVIDAEDAFIAMLNHQLRSLELRVTITHVGEAPSRRALIWLSSAQARATRATTEMTRL
ncbi:MAG: chorismate-binding protein [Pseudonocardiaceae bacterium]